MSTENDTLKNCHLNFKEAKSEGKQKEKRWKAADWSQNHGRHLPQRMESNPWVIFKAHLPYN